MAGMPQPPRRKAAWTFFVIAAVLMLLAGLAAFGSNKTGDTWGALPGIVVIVAAAAGSAQIGRRLLRNGVQPALPSRTASLVAAWICLVISGLLAAGTVALVITWAVKGLSDPVGLIYTVTSSLSIGQVGRVLLANRRRAAVQPAGDKAGPPAPVPSARPDCPRASDQARYGEACSNVNVIGVLLGLALLAFGVWVVAAFGGPGGKAGPQGFLVMVPVLPGLWLLFALSSLSYGIVLRDGWLQLGTRGIPPVGRLWLRAQVPLDAVMHWDVVSGRRFRAGKAAYHPVPGKPFGAMLGLRVRHVCWIQAEPELVQEYFPEVFMEGSAGVTSARAAGLTQNGLLYIGTRRPRALERALESALPGRRLGTGADAGRAIIDRAGDAGYQGPDLGSWPPPANGS
jgi:hypothetical protein